MSTAEVHMAADLDWLYTQEGEEVVDITIDDLPYRAIVQPLEAFPGEFEGSAKRRQMISLRASDMPTPPRQGYAMNVDGETWAVESSGVSGILVQIVMGQYD